MSNNDTRSTIENPDGGGYHEKMELRLSKIESDVAILKDDVAALKDDVVGLKIDVAVIRSNYVTKADLQQALHELTWRMYGFGTLLVGVVYFLDHYVR